MPDAAFSSSNYTDATPSPPPPSPPPPSVRPGPPMIMGHTIVLHNTTLAAVAATWINPTETNVRDVSILPDIIALPPTPPAPMPRTAWLHIPDTAKFGTPDWDEQILPVDEAAGRPRNATQIKFQLKEVVPLLWGLFSATNEIHAQLLFLDDQRGRPEMNATYLSHVPGVPVQVRQIRTLRQVEDGGVEASVEMYVWMPRYYHWFATPKADKVLKEMVDRLHTLL